MIRRRNSVAVLGLALALAASGCGQGSGGSASGGGSGSSGGGGGSDGNVKVAFVPKLQGIPYFEAMNTGGKAAARRSATSVAVPGADHRRRRRAGRHRPSYIQQKVDALFVAPNDPDSMAPLMQAGHGRGHQGRHLRHRRAELGAPGVRAAGLRRGHRRGDDRRADEAMGGKGKYAIVSCGETAENLNSWIDVQKTYTAKKYPDAEIVDTVYAGEDLARRRRWRPT